MPFVKVMYIDKLFTQCTLFLYAFCTLENKCSLKFVGLYVGPLVSSVRWVTDQVTVPVLIFLFHCIVERIDCFRCQEVIKV